MKICYKKLWVLLIQKDITKPQLRKDLKLATGTMSKLNKNEEVSMSVMLRICEYLNCDIGDICEVVPKWMAALCLGTINLSVTFPLVRNSYVARLASSNAHERVNNRKQTNLSNLYSIRKGALICGRNLSGICLLHLSSHFGYL